MKAILTIFAALAVFTLSPDATAAEPKSTPAKSVANVTFPNYWSANAWDREGGSNFWHADKDSRKAKKAAARQAKATQSGQSRR